MNTKEEGEPNKKLKAMKEHNFTPEQSEQILNAVHELQSWDGNFVCYMKYLNDLFTNRIDDSIIEDEGKKEINITPNYLAEISFKHRQLSDFFFDVEGVTSN